MWALPLLCLLSLVTGQQNPNLITNLPGAPPVNFKQYSGYITVNDTHGRTLFYWVVESQRDPGNDPLVLWLNGGPGCSSLAGLLSENGPLWVNEDGSTLRVNPDAWNKVATVVYLESPSGVGFSVSNTTSDYTTGDAQTASDTVVFLQRFLTQYPQYKNLPFWISGESYGGHYVPNLAKAITLANAAGQQPPINLVGFQVGNAWTDPSYDNLGAVEMWMSHAIISRDTYDGLRATCNFSDVGPLAAAKADPILCDLYQAKAFADMRYINIYQIYADVCLEDTENEATRLKRAIAEATPFSPYARTRRTSGLGGEYNPDPCIDDHVQAYLNIPDVQKALHANPTEWIQCSEIVDYSRSDLLTSVIPVYTWLMENTKLRMLVYSGDVDGIVPVIGTRNWMETQGWGIAEGWRLWRDSEDQTGGFTEKFSHGGNTLTFASVRGAGHMVPWTQPGRSFDLFSRFLFERPI